MTCEVASIASQFTQPLIVLWHDQRFSFEVHMRLCRCGAIVEGKCSRCDGKRSPPQSACKRGYDRRWRDLRARKLAHNPLCEVCELQGKVTAASEVHHIVPIMVDASKRLQWDNLLSVCSSCHVEVEGKPDPRQVHTGGG